MVIVHRGLVIGLTRACNECYDLVVKALLVIRLLSLIKVLPLGLKIEFAIKRVPSPFITTASSGTDLNRQCLVCFVELSPQ